MAVKVNLIPVTMRALHVRISVTPSEQGVQEERDYVQITMNLWTCSQEPLHGLPVSVTRPQPVQTSTNKTR